MTLSVPYPDDVNADLSSPAVVCSARMDWQPSPSGTVWRKPLYREGGEYGPVTSVVRYAPEGGFRPHPHPAGEEILVLSGVFSDEHGDYPSGTWMLNPEGYVHAPYSDPGCELLVRLRQYPGIGRARCQVNTRTASWLAGGVKGLSVLPLYHETAFPEFLTLARLAPGVSLPTLSLQSSVEYFVLEGSLRNGEELHAAGTWLRLPPRIEHTLSSPEGVRYYVRLAHGGSGHLYETFETDLNT